MNGPELTAEERRAYPPCPHCGLTGHKPDFCFELEQNASRRPYGWVSKNNNNAFCQPTDRTVAAGNLTSSGGIESVQSVVHPGMLIRIVQ